MAKVAITDDDSLGRYEPVVLTFDYEYRSAFCEPCVFPCCCSVAFPFLCHHPLSLCQSQRDKVKRVHDFIIKTYTKVGTYAPGGIVLSFRFEENEKGCKVTEIFRNIDAAEEYYRRFWSHPMVPLRALSNLPCRQKPGPEARVADGNVAAWVVNAAETLKKGKKTCMYNHLQWDGNPKGKVPVTSWDTAPSMAELEQQFGKFHFGWVGEPSAARTDTDTPEPQQMEG